MKVYKIITAGSTAELASKVNKKLVRDWYLYGNLVVVQSEKNRTDGYPGTYLDSEFYQPMLMHKKGKDVSKPS